MHTFVDSAIRFKVNVIGTNAWVARLETPRRKWNAACWEDLPQSKDTDLTRSNNSHWKQPKKKPAHMTAADWHHKHLRDMTMNCLNYTL